MAHARRERSATQRALLTTAVGLREVGLTILQVLLFFSIFMVILQFSLPKGTGLQSVYGDLLSDRKGRATVALNGDTAYDLGPVATLTEVTRRVKDRPADGVAWNTAAPGMQLEDRHAVQTLARSGATIAFANDNELWLDENSLVVIKRPSKGRARSRNASLTVLGGKVRGTVTSKGNIGRGIAVEVAGGSTEISSSTGEATEFSVQVNADQSSTLSVLSGLAEIQKAGQTIRMGPNHALTIDASGELGSPILIPDAPRSEFPGDGFVHTSGPSTPPLEFRWAATPNADGYRLLIASDSGFDRAVFDGSISATATRPANLGPGRYYWRVFALAGNSESEPGDVRTVDVVGDTEPPPLAVRLPEAAVEVDRLVVRGTTDPGCRIHIGGSAVDVGTDGEFAHEIKLSPGPNLVVIEAVDAAGNVNYHSQYVYAK